MSNVWFTSDTHFNHENLVEFRNEIHGQGRRLFGDVTDMNIRLLENYNKVIGKRDVVWHLGDVGMGKWDDTLSWLKMLPGLHWNLIPGNHDTDNMRKYVEYFNKIFGSRKYKGFMMTHIPVHPQELAYRNWPFNVHGHIHHKDKMLPSDKYFNVNVDVNNLMPVHLDDILAQFNIKHGGE